jgi:hypothetical protein
MNKPKFALKDVAAALEQSKGSASAAAEILAALSGGGCTPRTVRNYLRRHPELEIVIRAQRERILREAGQIFRKRQ